jgi:tetratricopeptide (TPR) repeat protein
MKTHPFLPSLSAFHFLFFLTLMLGAHATTPPAADVTELIKKNDFAAAEKLLTPLTAEGSTNAAAFFQLGNLRLKQQQANEAAVAFEKAIKLDATHAEYFSQYAIALSAKLQGAPMMTQATLAPKMKKAFEKSVELDPRHLPGLIGLTRYYSNAPEIAGGSIEKAKEFARRILAVDAFVGELELGNVAERSEDFADALSHYDAASKLQPKHAGAHVAAGRALIKLGRKDDARSRLEMALALAPTNAGAKKALAELDAP